MPSEQLIARAQRIANATHPLAARGGRLFALVREELQDGASDADALARARPRLAEETDDDGPTPPDRP